MGWKEAGEGALLLVKLDNGSQAKTAVIFITCFAGFTSVVSTKVVLYNI